MTDHQRLTKIIDVALKHGWQGPNWPYHRVGFNEDGRMSLLLLTKRGGVAKSLSIEDLLYGDDLNLLKYAVGNGNQTDDGNKFHRVNGSKDYDWVLQSSVDVWVAQTSVKLPSTKRLAFVCDHLRED